MLGILRRAWVYANTEPGFYFALFLVVWFSAWVANGLKITAFDLDRLRDLFFFIAAKYGIDSGLNTPIGKPVKRE